MCAISSCSVETGVVASALADDAAVNEAPHNTPNSPDADAIVFTSASVEPRLELLVAVLKVEDVAAPLRLREAVTSRSVPVSAVEEIVTDPVLGATL